MEADENGRYKNVLFNYRVYMIWNFHFMASVMSIIVCHGYSTFGLIYNKDYKFWLSRGGGGGGGEKNTSKNAN